MSTENDSLIKNKNPIIQSALSLIGEPYFIKNLKKISKCKISRFEKWFQIELAISFENNQCDPFIWKREFTYNHKVECECEKPCEKIIPDFEATVKTQSGEEKYFVEITQINKFSDCLDKMVEDQQKFKNDENINCIGIFETHTFKEKDNFINELKIHNIDGTEYSLMYF